MIKLFFTNLKMTTRNSQALFWSLFFPLVFTFIFGMFFGGDNASIIGDVALINNSESELAQNFEKVLDESEVFSIEKNIELDEAKKEIQKGKLSGAIVVPESFGKPVQGAATKIKIVYDPVNAQSYGVIAGYVNNFLTQVNFQTQNAKPIYTIEDEKTNANELNYFDFVLIGLIGMSLMNSSVQGVSISMSKYREDKILKRITTTPLPAWKFIFAEVFSRLTINFIQISFILLFGIYIFGAHIYGNIGLIFVLSLLGAILFQSIGFVVAALSKTTQAAEGMSIAITIPMMFLAGVFFPIDQLPVWLYSIVRYLPLAPLLRMIRDTALENVSIFNDSSNLIIVLVWIVVALSISIYRFRLTEE
ncbi:ABC transporter permease [Patescibacteria group bacterium]